MHPTSILSMFPQDSLLSVYPPWPRVYFSLYQPIMNGLVCSSVPGQFEYRFFVRYAFFRKTIVFIFGCVGSLCVGFSLVRLSVGHN